MGVEFSVLRWRWLAGLLVAAVVAFVFWVPVRGGFKKEADGANVTVMTYNIWDLGGKRPALKHVEAVIRHAGIPDVLLLQEVRGEKMAALLAESLGFHYYLYREDQARGHPYGVSILSRYPLIESRSLCFKSSKAGRGALEATVVLEDLKLRVCSVHLDRIEPIAEDKKGVHPSWDEALFLLARETTAETVRSRCVEELLAWVGSDRVIVGGDFNTVFCSKAIRKMEAVFVDALTGSSDYLTGTYIKSGLPVAPRLDFLFHSKDLRCIKACVVRESAGDHFPVWAKVGFEF